MHAYKARLAFQRRCPSFRVYNGCPRLFSEGGLLRFSILRFLPHPRHFFTAGFPSTSRITTSPNWSSLTPASIFEKSPTRAKDTPRSAVRVLLRGRIDRRERRLLQFIRLWLTMPFSCKAIGPEFFYLSRHPVHGLELLRIAAHARVFCVGQFFFRYRLLFGYEIQLFLEFHQGFLRLVRLYSPESSPDSVFRVGRGKSKNAVRVSFLLSYVDAQTRSRRAARTVFSNSRRNSPPHFVPAPAGAPPPRFARRSDDPLRTLCQAQLHAEGKVVAAGGALPRQEPKFCLASSAASATVTSPTRINAAPPGFQ